MIDIERARKSLKEDRITVGVATCGISAGALPVLNRLRSAKLGILVEGVGCIGACYAEPIVMVRQDGMLSIYGNVDMSRVEELISSIRKKKVCKGLLLGHSLKEIKYYDGQKRLMLENCGIINPLDIGQYAALGGFIGLKKAISMPREKVIEEISYSADEHAGESIFVTKDLVHERLDEIAEDGDVSKYIL